MQCVIKTHLSKLKNKLLKYFPPSCDIWLNNMWILNPFLPCEKHELSLLNESLLLELSSTKTVEVWELNLVFLIVMLLYLIIYLYFCRKFGYVTVCGLELGISNHIIIIRRERNISTSNYSRGGMLIAIRNNIPSSLLTTSVNSVEHIFVKISVHKKIIL